MEPITFTVYGRPQQRGSKQACLIPKRGGGWVTNDSGRPIVAARDANKNSKAWMSEVAAAAHHAFSGELIHAPIHLTVKFLFRRPQSHFRTGKFAEMLRENAPKYHAQTPDIDKLIRCLSDSLTGVIWRDDRQICLIDACKQWTLFSECAEVTVRAIHE